MNPVVLVHFLVSILVIAMSVPLIRRKVRMNSWYGVRTPAAFESEMNWFRINQHGGLLFLLWGLAIGVTATMGAFLKRKDWIIYDGAALAVIVGGLVCVIVQVSRYAKKMEKS